MFRLLPSTIHRTDESLLDNIQVLLQQRNNVEELFNDCADAAVMCLGNSKRSAGRQRRQAEDAENEDAVQDVGSHSWAIHVAQLIAKIVASLQRDLLEERRLLQYVAHWCNTPSQRQPGCAYADCCVKYDASETENFRILNRQPRCQPPSSQQHFCAPSSPFVFERSWLRGSHRPTAEFFQGNLLVQ